MRSGDLAVGQPGGGQAGHAAFGLGQLLRGGGAQVDPGQLVGGLRGPSQRTEVPELRQRLADRLMRERLGLGPPVDLAGHEQGPGPVETQR
jgi:hypothetical protein